MERMNACRLYGSEYTIYNTLSVRDRTTGSYVKCPAYDRWKKLRNDKKPRYDTK